MKKLFYFLISLITGIGALTAQTQRVSGTVISVEDGEPIIGASVLVKGTTVGIATDANGAFTLDVPAGAKTLLVSYLGMITQEVAVQPTVIVRLQPDTRNLDEVIVVGYGTQRKKDVTSSISQVKGSEVSDKASPSFLQQMAGRAAGVQIISGSGSVNEAPRVVIRGIGTISSSQQPLYVINGVPVTSGDVGYSNTTHNALADINPADIESFEILKDGAATAIYGSRAANGVVLITTKQGKQGSAKLAYDGWIGWSTASKLHDLLDANEFVTIANEKYINNGAQPQAFMDDKGTNTNWLDYTFRTGIQHSHTVSISGASVATQYFLSAGYTNQEGIVTANSYDRYTFYGRGNHSFLKDYAAIGFSLNASVQNNQGPLKGTNSINDNMYAATRMLPNVAVYNPDDPTGYNIDPQDRKSLGKGANLRTIENTISNAVWSIYNNRNWSSSWRLLPTAYIDIKPAKWLTFRSQIGADVMWIDDGYVWSPDSGDGFGYKGLISRSSIRRQRWNFQNVLTFNRDFGVHHVDATAVAEYNNYVYSRFSATGRDFSDPFYVDELISNTFATQGSSGSYTTNGLASYIFRANYNYNGLVYVGGSVRRDGISVLHPDNRWGTFYGGSAAFRLSNLSFWKESSVSEIINDLRLRGSFAEVGNDRLSADFMYKDTFIGQKYGDQSGIAYDQVGNAGLKWERQRITDAGFDMAFLNSRFNLVFAYWSKDNTDIVLDVPTPPSLGIPWNNIAQNYGSIKNDGIELELGGYVIQGKDLTWRTSLNFSTQNSKVVTLADDIPHEHYILREGESVNALWGYVYEGVNKANGNPMYRKKDGVIIQADPKTSRYFKYDAANPTEMTEQLPLTVDDKVIFGNSIPAWFGGWDNTVTWNSFDFNVFLRYSGGNKVANVTRREMLSMGFVNNSREILGRWQSPEQPGDGNVPIVIYGKSSFLNLDADGSSRWVEDGKFLKVQNVAVGYSLPAHICRTLFVEKARIYVQAQNLLTLTPYTGLDPEGYASYTTTQVPGIDWNSNPQQRTFLVGINIGF